MLEDDYAHCTYDQGQKLPTRGGASLIYLIHAFYCIEGFYFACSTQYGNGAMSSYLNYAAIHADTEMDAADLRRVPCGEVMHRVNATMLCIALLSSRFVLARANALHEASTQQITCGFPPLTEQEYNCDQINNGFE